MASPRLQRLFNKKELLIRMVLESIQLNRLVTWLYPWRKSIIILWLLHLNIKVGLSKFCHLRPPNIKLFDSIPHNICVCIYHENMRLLLEVLSKYTKLSESFQEFVDQVTCYPSVYDRNFKIVITVYTSMALSNLQWSSVRM